jgi:hypothetical protein
VELHLYMVVVFLAAVEVAKEAVAVKEDVVVEAKKDEVAVAVAVESPIIQIILDIVVL